MSPFFILIRGQEMTLKIIRLLIPFIFLISFDAQAITDFWYNSGAQAQAACTAAKGSACDTGNTLSGQTQCVGGTASVYTKPTSGAWVPPYIDTYRFCTGATTCQVGYTLNTAGTCVPPACLMGSTKPVMAIESQRINGELDMMIGGDANGNATTCFAGCNYAYNRKIDATGNYAKSADGNTDFNEYTGTALGTSCTSGTAPTSAPAKPDKDCITDATGKIVCNTNDKCGTIQGTPTSTPVKFCPDATDKPDCVKIPGFKDQVCSPAPKNCGWVNGQYICVEPDTGAARNPNNEKTCLVNGVQKNCITGQEGTETTTETTTTTNPDGGTTTTTTTDDNVIGDTPSESSETTHPDGSKEKTETGGGGSTGGDGTGDKYLAGIESNTAAIKTNTSAGNELMTSIKSFLDPSGVDSGVDLSTVGLNDEFNTQIATIGADQYLISDDDYLPSASEIISLPDNTSCDGVYGQYKSVNFSFDPCEKLAPMRDIIGWFFYIGLVLFAYKISIK